jgi:hypothetical protein
MADPTSRQRGRSTKANTKGQERDSKAVKCGYEPQKGLDSKTGGWTGVVLTLTPTLKGWSTGQLFYWSPRM